MKRYLIACIETDITKEGITPQDIEFSNPVVFTYESNQMLDDVVSKYHLNLRIDPSVTTIAIALTDKTDATSANIIVKTLGKKFTYENLFQYRMFLDIGSSICIDALVDFHIDVNPQTLFPDWMFPTKKRENFFASKLQ